MAHSIKVKIYYEDTDAGGIVYHANYLRYLERARTEFLKEQGIDVAEYHRKGIFFAVVHIDIYYKSPAQLGDILTVTTEVAEIKKASLTVKNQIFKDDRLLVEAFITFACLNSSYRPLRLPEAFSSLSVSAIR